MKIESLRDLLYDHLRDLYDAEKMLVKTLPKIAKAVHSEELREAVKGHLQQTENHVSRLEQVFEHLGQPAKSKPCQGMRGLIEEGKEVMEEDASERLFDLAVIAAAQKVEHYEISAYGTAREFADQIGEAEVVSLLDETLAEEKETDSKLTEIARTLLDAEPEGQEEVDQEEGDEEAKRQPAASVSGRANRAGRRAS